MLELLLLVEVIDEDLVKKAAMKIIEIMLANTEGKPSFIS
jgi:hypothetical protein